MNLRKRFEKLNESKAPSTDYAVMYGWDELPNDAPETCMILCTNREVFAREFGMQIAGKRSRKAFINDIACRFTLVQKGEGLFAETFESEIIARRTITNGCIYIPSPDHHAMLLIALGFRNDPKVFTQKDCKKIIGTYLNQRVGVGRRITILF